MKEGSSLRKGDWRPETGDKEIGSLRFDRPTDKFMISPGVLRSVSSANKVSDVSRPSGVQQSSLKTS